MKFYPKKYEEICEMSAWSNYDKSIEATTGSLTELIMKFRSFYKDAHEGIFMNIVKEVWLERQIKIDGKVRIKRRGNGMHGDMAFGKFTKVVVGASPKVLTAAFHFYPVATYLIDFFPEFMMHDPFKNPEKYKYPYENVRLDFLIFVYQMENRLELLQYAEERKLSYAEFINWANNWRLCYADDTGDDRYHLAGGHYHWPFIRNKKLRKHWENLKFTFNVDE